MKLRKLGLIALLGAAGVVLAWGTARAQYCPYGVVIVGYAHPYDVVPQTVCNSWGCHVVSAQMPCGHPIWGCR